MAGMGFRLGRTQGIEGSSGNLRTVPIATGYSTAIFRGDMATLVAGYVQRHTGAAALEVLGIFWGCEYTEADGSKKWSRHWDGVAGRTNIKAHISLLPAGSTALIKGDSGETYTQADIGTTKGFTPGTGNSATGQSRSVLGAAGASVANAPLIVLEELEDLDGDGVNWFEVAINNAQAVVAAGI